MRRRWLVLVLLAGVLVAPAARASAPHGWWTVTASVPNASVVFTVDRPTLLRDDREGRFFPLWSTARPPRYVGYLVQRLDTRAAVDGAVLDPRHDVGPHRQPLWWPLYFPPDRPVLQPHVRYVLTYLSDQPGRLSFETGQPRDRALVARSRLLQVQAQDLPVLSGEAMTTVSAPLTVPARSVALVAAVMDASGTESVLTYSHQCLAPVPQTCASQSPDGGSVTVHGGIPGQESWLGSATTYLPPYFPTASTQTAQVEWANAAVTTAASAWALVVS